MSFINKENFMAPFSNVVNLVAIVSVAGLFLLWRMMGGGFEIASVQTERAPVQPATNQQQTVGTPVAPSNARDLRRQEDDVFQRQTAPVERPREERDTGQSGLDEIERSLGLR